MKKLISVLLCLVMVIGLIPLTSAPAKAAGGWSGDWYYEVDSDGRTVITSYDVFGTDLVFPAKLGGNQVQYIDIEDCESFNAIDSMTLPDGLQRIGDLGEIMYVQYIRIPKSVTQIDDSVFRYADELTDVYFGGTRSQWNQITIGVGNKALFDAELHCQTPFLRAKYIHEDGLRLNWTGVNGAAKYRLQRSEYTGGSWSAWTTLATVTGLTYSDPGAAEGTQYRYRVKALVGGDWKGYSNVEELTAQNIFKYTVNADGSVTIDGYREWIHELTIPSALNGKPVTAIGYSAFYENDSYYLNVITIPEGVTRIEGSAFMNSGLDVAYLPATLKTIEGCAFFGTGLRDVYYNGCKAQWKKVSIESYNDELTDSSTLTMHYLAPTLSVNAVGGQNDLSWNNAVEGAEKYRVYRREDNSGVWSDWSLKKTVTSGRKWSDKDVVPEVRYQYRVKAYVNGEWKGYSNTVTAVGIAEFFFELDGADLWALRGYNGPGGEVTIPSEYNGEPIAPYIDMYAFCDCDTITGVTVPEGIRAIGECAFEGCYNLKTVRLPSTLVLIDDGAFCYCGALSDIYYNGCKASWKKIDFANNNLTGATMHYLAPTLSGTAASKKNSLSWNNAVEGAKKFRVYRREKSGGSWSGWTLKATVSSGRKWNDEEVTAGVKYQYRVKAYVNGEWKAYSNIVELTAVS